MQHDGRASKRYATAIFKVAQSENMISAVDSDLIALTAALRSNDEFRHFMGRPDVADSDKLNLFDKVFGDKVTSLTHSFFKMLVDKRRADQIFGIQKEFAELRRISENVTKASITSAVALDSAQQKAVITKLETQLGHKVEAEFEVDASVIGGLKIIYDNFILDGTVRGQLDRMTDKILYDVLKQA